LPLLLNIYLKLITALDYTHSSYTKQLSELPKSTKVKSHGNNVLDVIIVHMISGDAQINRPTDAENEKPCAQPAGKRIRRAVAY